MCVVDARVLEALQAFDLSFVSCPRAEIQTSLLPSKRNTVCVLEPSSTWTASAHDREIPGELVIFLMLFVALIRVSTAAVGLTRVRKLSAPALQSLTTRTSRPVLSRTAGEG